MSRALKVKTRGGKGALPLPQKTAPSPAQNVANYDGRARTAAGEYLQKFALDDVQGPGNTVGWLKTVLPGK